MAVLYRHTRLGSLSLRRLSGLLQGSSGSAPTAGGTPYRCTHSVKGINDILINYSIIGSRSDGVVWVLPELSGFFQHAERHHHKIWNYLASSKQTLISLVAAFKVEQSHG